MLSMFFSALPYMVYAYRQKHPFRPFGATSPLGPAGPDGEGKINPLALWERGAEGQVRVKGSVFYKSSISRTFRKSSTG